MELITSERRVNMISFANARRLAELEKKYEIICNQNANRLDAVSRGALVWGGKGQAIGREKYLARVLPALKSLADAGDDAALASALDAVDAEM